MNRLNGVFPQAGDWSCGGKRPLPKLSVAQPFGPTAQRRIPRWEVQQLRVAKQRTKEPLLDPCVRNLKECKKLLQKGLKESNRISL